MLLRFGVSNYRSIKDYQELSLIASSYKDSPDYLISVEGLAHKVLPCIGLYGANASGKSNILKAFNFMKGAIFNSHQYGSADEEIPVKTFLLDEEFRHKTSKFDCDFLLNKIRYTYGFILDNKKIHEEWLYAYPEGRRQVWFHRNINEEHVFSFGKNLKGRNSVIRELTRDNSLYLSAAAQNNHEQISPIYKYFNQNYSSLYESSLGASSYLIEKLEDKDLYGKVLDFIKFADVGITDAVIEELSFDEETSSFRDDVVALLSKHIDEIKPESLANTMSHLKTLSFVHQGENKYTTTFSLANESRGTLSTLNYLVPAFDALLNGKILLIDELDTSMHTLLAVKFLMLFCHPKTNPSNAQLIFTTHDTNLLCSNILRRDEIWFTEKTRGGATHLYPLSDYKTRNTDNLQNGYLQGRFGAIPFLGHIDDLLDKG